MDITALETSLTGVFQLMVRKDLRLRWPRGETPTHYITMGMHEDLREAARLAVEQMIEFLTVEKHLRREDAYMLASVAADLSITQLVHRGTDIGDESGPSVYFYAGAIDGVRTHEIGVGPLPVIDRQVGSIDFDERSHSQIGECPIITGADDALDRGLGNRHRRIHDNV
jgi:hypothetical protein